MELQSRWTAPVSLFLSPRALVLCYLCFFAYLSYCVVWLRSIKRTMARSTFIALGGFLLSAWTLLIYAQSSTPASSTATAATEATAATTTTSYRAIPTVPASAQFGQNVLPNIADPEAIDPQSVCPGYTLSNVIRTASGLTASLS